MKGSSWAPVALVAGAMLYAALVPTLLHRTPDRLRAEIQGIIEPARRVASTRQASLAIEVSAYRAYVISRDPRLLDRVREARTRSDELGAQLRVLTSRIDPETARAAALVDERIRDWHRTTGPRQEVDLETYRPTLFWLQDRFEATQAAAENLELILARKTEERARQAGKLILYHDLGNVALSLLAVAAVLAVTRLAHREQRARTRAESAVRSRDQVVSIVSHDLRSPLTTVSAAARYVLGLPSTDEGWTRARPLLEMIKRGTDRMDRMIEDLLDVARIESGGLAIETSTLAVESFRRRWRPLCGPTWRGMANGWTVACPRDCPRSVPITTGCFRSSPTSSATPSSSRRRAARSRWRRRRTRAGCASPYRTRAPASRPRMSRTCSTASGKRRAPTGGGSASAFPS
jgi:hypothetical protein